MYRKLEEKLYMVSRDMAEIFKIYLMVLIVDYSLKMKILVNLNI